MSGPRFDPMPSSVWVGSALQLPPRVISDYREQLEALGRYEDACGVSPRNLTGGADEEATLDHFTWRFGASCVRTEYLMLDPRGALAPVSTDILTCFSEGRVAILDVPCGTAPGILGFLGLVAELRIHRCLPRQPLELSITAGDLSESACNLYRTMLQQAQPWLANEGIRVKWNVYPWDARDESSTAKLVDNWFRESSGSEEYVVLTAAFSGQAANNFALYERSFSHIAARLYNKRGAIIWLEPRWSKGNKLLASVLRMFQSMFTKWFGTQPQLADTFRWQHPFRDEQPNGSLLVLRHERVEALE